MQLNLQHANIAYQLFGEGQPIIFLHGMGMDHHSMQIPYEPILASRPYKRL
ncbi:hypothetical protein YK48G_06590 [Lentilactobacillus fungorum]|uniref:Alpha/beta hydrolase n=1 Tax=Lentilactobacillus fungorum TaxID=2201250 RepID=A0ABQ3VZB8_9LACO|nr:hypothetical protein [Lentilactobacillus fungorum]GHP13234.1 hypothetical protein YK48G_06590 [Lentilactobacillus fungorum]